VPVRWRGLRPGELRQRRLQIGRAHVRPDDAARLDRRIRWLADLVLEGELFGLVHHVHAAAGHVELPAVVDAAQAAFLVAPEEQGCAPMGAELLEEPDAALGVAEGHEILAQELHPDGRTVGRGQFPGEQRRDPVAPQRVPHGCAGANASDELVFFVGQHGVLRAERVRVERAL
jgi:hypothetical protein